MSIINGYKLKLWFAIFASVLLLFSQAIGAYKKDFIIPESFSLLKPILKSRINQKSSKMKLSHKQVESFAEYLNKLSPMPPELIKLQRVLPKTTLELLMAVHSRGLSLAEAEKMAAYLQHLLHVFKFQNPGAFDENTSHIIGREWQEIDYSGENMTWQKQRAKYLPYGILNFKSLEMLKKFFAVESRLPYFRKIYRPRFSSSSKNI